MRRVLSPPATYTYWSSRYGLLESTSSRPAGLSKTLEIAPRWGSTVTRKNSFSMVLAGFGSGDAGTVTYTYWSSRYGLLESTSSRPAGLSKTLEIAPRWGSAVTRKNSFSMVLAGFGSGDPHRGAIS